MNTVTITGRFTNDPEMKITSGQGKAVTTVRVAINEQGRDKTTETLCACVVIFNRVSLLRECLYSLRRQSRMLDCIVVVDNASTDNTEEVLAREFAEVQVVRLLDNVGGAGGFRAGMEWAYSHGFRWFWVMDDDIELQPDALEVMLRYRELSDWAAPA